MQFPGGFWNENSEQKFCSVSEAPLQCIPYELLPNVVLMAQYLLVDMKEDDILQFINNYRGLIPRSV